MEAVFKIVITGVILCIIYFEVIFLRGVWRSQIDPAATVSRIIEALKPKTTEVIATRDPNKIYQDGKVVGDVTGQINERDNIVTFTRILNTSALKTDQPFEYRRLRLKIVRIGTRSGFYVGRNDTETTSGTDVLTDVVCERLDN
jgi:hypothetical protein